jgi:hypothetical protein
MLAYVRALEDKTDGDYLSVSVSVRLAYKPYFLSQQTVFFSHKKSANSTFGHGFSAKRIGRCQSCEP